MAAYRSPFVARPAGGRSPLASRARTRAIESALPHPSRTASEREPGVVLSLLLPSLRSAGKCSPTPSLASGGRGFMSLEGISAGEGEVWAIQEYITSTSPCGEDLIFLGRLLKESKLVLSRQGRGGSGRKHCHAVVPWKAHIQCLFPETTGNQSSREDSREKVLRSCKNPRPSFRSYQISVFTSEKWG